MFLPVAAFFVDGFAGLVWLACTDNPARIEQARLVLLDLRDQVVSRVSRGNEVFF